MLLDFTSATWLHQPRTYNVTNEMVTITTEPGTDFWQRSYYGFRNDNGHALLWESRLNFTFTVRASFDYKARFDQCGIILYPDGENWFKASIEYETGQFSHLGSVVTNHGYSDWATTEISPVSEMWYRLHRRGPDFLVENSVDGRTFKQMRVFHVHVLGETTAEMGKMDPREFTKHTELAKHTEPAKQAVRFGLYACSPLDSSFTAQFGDFGYDECMWKAHKV